MNRKHILMAAAQAAESPKVTGSANTANATASKPAETAPTAAATTTQSAASPQAAAIAQPAGAAPVAAANTAPTDTTVPSTTDPTLAAATETRKRAPKDPANTLNIINGRLPLPLVFLIRTKEVGKPTGDVAKRYGTSVGKVFDIFKGRNFGYIKADYRPSAEEMAAADAWLTTAKTAKGQSLKEAGGDPEGISAMLKTLTVASAEEVAKRNWEVRQVGQPAAANQAPSAPAGTAPAAGATTAAPAEKPAGAKLF